MGSSARRHARLRAADRHARQTATRWRHDGSEAQWARSDLRLRRLLSLWAAPVFVFGSALLSFLASRATPQADPSRSVYVVLAAICFALAVLAIIDLRVIEHRMREQTRWHRPT
ncbi:hypothetical protein [Streptomyces avidinii]|uniref:DUF202 domain-containing protein n=1 Tax=Streptomyces avidinii TaxID=1895 RepID=A0ABS4L1F2_STRAV|nr:hypothetical protein [Streptomyces avidinii]MBP2034959.1 hypothetical protein [Streptomyces avidinii]GGY90076.1 hypothetical protein GCM10010343_14390 [Streptomyces avidinii]